MSCCAITPCRESRDPEQSNAIQFYSDLTKGKMTTGMTSHPHKILSFCFLLSPTVDSLGDVIYHPKEQFEALHATKSRVSVEFVLLKDVET